VRERPLSRPSRFALWFINLLVLLSSVGPATAQTDLSGEYGGTQTFDDITPPCIDAGTEGTFTGSRMKVEMRGTSNVDITFYSLPRAGENTVFNASLNADLNAYAEHEKGWTITGQFLVTGTDVSFSGRVQWTQECPIDTNNTYQPVPQRFTFQMERISGGEDAQVGTGITDLPPGVQLADQALSSDCDVSKQVLPENCAAANEYSMEWKAAIDADIDSLSLDDRADVFLDLDNLRRILGRAALLGSLLVDTPGGRVSRFPVVHALLNVFAFLFIQGVSAAATGQIDSVRATVARADALLFAAVSEETRFGRP
jgi:hypothetical protein